MEMKIQEDLCIMVPSQPMEGMYGWEEVILMEDLLPGTD